METLTKIVTGMEKGPEAIDTNFEALNADALSNKITDTGWTSAGVVCINGFTSNPDDPLQYRIIKFGSSGLQIIQLSGIIAYFKVEKSVAKEFAVLPNNVKALLDGTAGYCKSIIGREASSGGGTVVEFGLNSTTATLNVQSRPQDIVNESIFMDLLLFIGQPKGI